MSFVVLIVLGSLLAIAAGLGVLNLLPKKDEGRKLLTSARRTAIKDARVGAHVKVVGVAQTTGELLVAPLSQRRCIAYQLVVTEQLRDGIHTIVDEALSSPFTVSDPTGKALVDPRGAVLSVEMDTRNASSFMRAAPPELIELLQKRGEKTTEALGFNRMLSYHEGVISEGERVAVLGTVGREESAPNAGYRDAPRLTLSSRAGHPLRISDHADTRL